MKTFSQPFVPRPCNSVLFESINMSFSSLSVCSILTIVLTSFVYLMLLLCVAMPLYNYICVYVRSCKINLNKATIFFLLFNHLRSDAIFYDYWHPQPRACLKKVFDLQKT